MRGLVLSFRRPRVRLFEPSLYSSLRSLPVQSKLCVCDQDFFNVFHNAFLADQTDTASCACNPEGCPRRHLPLLVLKLRRLSD